MLDERTMILTTRGLIVRDNSCLAAFCYIGRRFATNERLA